jgi:cellulose synthase/poly-beta-1,6-N-acetylglucosamine synthase-like glycosyltransferase
MLTRALLLSAGWLLLSALTTFARGTRVKRGGPWRSLAWLFLLIAIGDLWAILTFGIPGEMAALSGVALLSGGWWIRKRPSWNGLGHALWTFSLLTTALYLAYSFAVTTFTPLHPLAFLLATILLFFEAAALLLALSFTYETIDVCCRLRWQRRVESLPTVPGYAPMVSLHVPAYNEPPEVVADTVRSLARLDYPNFEVLLVDNNTPDEARWRPLEALCRELGDHFQCLHLDRWPGYKSGALNFALAQTAPEAEIVGIIDADYLVEPGYLRDLVPAFADPAMAFVQTPQDYRDYQGNAFLEASYHAYKYFFNLSMPSRNEHNAIIFGGTMGLIRKSALQEIGGWDEWCITEDAEASLRILKRGYQSLFVNITYGRGLMPFTFEGLKKQRFRWCFGGIQILKKHWEALLPWGPATDPDNRLTLAQRYYYLAGGLQWFNDPLNLCFAFFLLLGGLLLLSPAGFGIRPLVGPLLIMPFIFLSLALWRFLWALRHSLRLSRRDALLAMGGFFSLGWSVTLGCIQGLIQKEGVFMRTPKTRSRLSWVRAVRAVQWETAIGTTCAALAIALIVLLPRAETLFVAGLLGWQATLYLCALLFSVISIRGREPERLTSRADIRQREVPEGRAARWALALLLLLLIGVGVLRSFPTPEDLPRYAQLQPPEVPARQIVGLEAVPIERRGDTPTPRPTATADPSEQLTPTPTPTLPPGVTLESGPADASPSPTLPTPALPATAIPGTPPPPAATPPAGTVPPSPTPVSLPTAGPSATSPASPQPTSPLPTPPVTLPAATPSATPAPEPTPQPLPTQPPTPTQALQPTPPAPTPPGP